MSIDLQEHSAIYLQIAQYGLDQLLDGHWEAGERIPSVRQLAGEVGVNPNTVVQAYQQLEEWGIIQKQRGIGFFVAEDGLVQAKNHKKTTFLNELLPEVRRIMQQLDISAEEFLKLLLVAN